MTTSMQGGLGMLSPQGRAGNKLPSGTKLGQIQQFTPEQLQLFQQLFSHAKPDSFLGKLAAGEEGAFAEAEAPALRQFNELQGGLASRFSGMGSGARRSSGFQNQSSAAASNFAQELQANRMNLQRQALNDLMGISSNLLGQRPYEQFAYEKPSNNWGGLGGALAGGAGGFFLGGPAGALKGAKLGFDVGSAF